MRKVTEKAVQAIWAGLNKTCSANTCVLVNPCEDGTLKIHCALHNNIIFTRIINPTGSMVDSFPYDGPYKMTVTTKDRIRGIAQGLGIACPKGY